VPRDGRLEVESLGKCALVIDGEETSRGAVDEGAVLELKNALVLYVTRRAPLETCKAYPAPAFAFGTADPCGIVGESAAAWELRDALAMAARGPHHVLLQGASGTGKELAARAFHHLSSRAKGPFVARNAATFPEGLVDAELFGSAKNYPHAGSPERPGLIGEADGGTLFLDEIGELPQAMQAHLLRVLDAGGEHQRLGESRTRRADLRVVAATNRPLDSLKHDLVARFATRIQVPPFAERRDDIPLLCRHILARFAEDAPEIVQRLYDTRDGGAPEARVDPRLISALLRHDFTHHLRELDRLLWLAVTTTREPFVALTPEVTAELRLPTAEPDAESVRAALAAADGNVSRAAKKIACSRFQLYRLMKRYGIAAREEEED
jgi:two-component system nitrogen regulation response regulator GlnG/two-component system response regulator HydG